MNNNLLKCVESLKDVRRCMQSDADPSVVAALSAAIAKLESCAVEGDPAQPCLAEAALGALAVISDVVTCLNVLAELVQHLRA
jgi:hypothetical protein